MSGISFEFDEGAFRREAERVVNETMQEQATNLQRALDSVASVTSAGTPVPEVKATLASALRRADFTPDSEQLTDWATLISEGTKITVQADEVHL